MNNQFLIMNKKTPKFLNLVNKARKYPQKDNFIKIIMHKTPLDKTVFEETIQDF